jgi:hypothetical protein
LMLGGEGVDLGRIRPLAGIVLGIVDPLRVECGSSDDKTNPSYPG